MKIAIIGDYDENRRSHIATSESIQKTTEYLSIEFSAQWISTKSLETKGALNRLLEFDGIFGAPGDSQSSSGVINAIQIAREKNIPYFGT